MVDCCCRGGDSFRRGTLFCAEVVEAMGYRLSSSHSHLLRPKSRAIAVLVRAVGARAIRTWSGYRLRVMGYGRTLFHLLSAGDYHTECADCGSRRTRGMGDGGVRIDERSPRRSAPLDHKYITSVPNLAFFAQK